MYLCVLSMSNERPETTTMQITRYTDYGLRILSYLAVLPKERLASIDEISDAYEISRNTVNKVVHQLGKDGYIETRRGKGGGIRLLAQPEAINIGAVVKLLEGDQSAIDCHSLNCRIMPACGLQGIFKQATQSFFDTLAQYTLADAINQRDTKIIRLLGLSK